MGGWVLIVETGPEAGRRMRFDDALVIGRDADGEGRLQSDPEVSRRHAEIRRREGGGLAVEDLGSANGTKVNAGSLAPGAGRRLEAGDTLTLGATALRLEHGDSELGSVALESTLETTLPGASSEALPAEQRGSPSSINPVPAPPTPAAPPTAEILHAGTRLPIPAAGLRLGREEGNDLVLSSPTLSREHAVISAAQGRYFVEDLGTRNGTALNGERLHGESRWLNSGDSIEIGGETLRFLAGQGTRIGTLGELAASQEPQVIQPRAERLTIGRDPGNLVALEDPNVSRFHAEIRRVGGAFELRDLGSRNGTRLDGEFIQRPAALTPGSEVGIGPFRLIFDGANFVHRDDRGALRLSADRVSTVVGGKTILNRASIEIEPGEFVVIIGASGSGKTTLVKALAGVVRPSGGEVRVSGEPLMNRLTDIGYVPQDEIVHRLLSVEEALRYAAALRLPRDAGEAQIEEAMRRVLEDLQLGAHTETMVGALSGGQRKRVGVGTELLNRPSLLFLDEPTTGLDPGLETRLMELFRSLAEEGRRAVTVVTHATKNLDLADKVCVMGEGGELCFFGPPEEAKRFFGSETYDGIYTALEARPAVEWRAEFETRRARREAASEAGVETQAPAPPSAAPATRARASALRQTALLASRYVKLLLRDRRNLALLIGQVPLIAIGIALLFHRNVFATGIDSDPDNATLVFFLMITAAIWLGSIDGSREIIKERALMERENAVGVKLSAYLASKALVLFSLVAVQCFALALVTFLLRPLHQSGGAYLGVLFILLLAGFIAVGVGLLISAVVSSEDQAASVIPLTLIPQLLFAGAIVGVSSMSAPMRALSDLVFARWALAGAGRAGQISQNIGERARVDRVFGAAERYGTGFFSHPFSVSALVLAAFLVAAFGAIYAVLAAQTRR